MWICIFKSYNYMSAYIHLAKKEGAKLSLK